MEVSSVARQVLLSALPILLAITVHEVSHGFVAYRLGDPTAKNMGRLTLNPIAHIDLIGTIILPLLLFITTGFVIGYAKPVPINPGNFKNPKRDMAISAAAGPAVNLLLAVLSIVIIRLIVFPVYMIAPESIIESIIMPVHGMLKVSAIINVVLALFNMFPIPPLDGGRVAIGLLPHRQAAALSRLEPYGFMIIIVLFFILGIGRFIFAPFINLVHWLTG